jgi:hydrogenase maturation protease
VGLKTLVVGVGNSILGDDGIGLRVAQTIRNNLPKNGDVDVKELSVGGLELMEELLGYNRVIIIDAMTTEREAGTIYKLTPDEFNRARHLSSPHDLNFMSALELGKKHIPGKMPNEISIYTIGVKEVTTFTEKMDPKVIKAGAKVAKIVLNELTRCQHR